MLLKSIDANQKAHDQGKQQYRKYEFMTDKDHYATTIRNGDESALYEVHMLKAKEMVIFRGHLFLPVE
ncbi:MAG: hypothetical protein NTY09_15535, partial [bacterium]|nr:hypothetical protein [bacterium]